jgi:para-aminobenzoate synthetase component 1
MGTQEVELAVSPTELLLRCVDEPFAFVLDGQSAASWGSGHALLGFRPRATLHVTAHGEARVWHAGAVQQWHGDPFALLDRFVAEWGPPANAAALSGGVIAALSYDLRHWVERLPPRQHDELHLPVLYAAAYDWLLAYSYHDGRYRLASHSRSASELECLAAELAARAAIGIAQPALVGGMPVVSDFTKDEYVQAVETSLAYIAAGDVYQVNLAQRFASGPRRAPAALFAALQRQHAMPFAAYIDAGDFALVSNSPECFLTRRQHQVATFPIKGTRRRGADPQTDAALARALQADPKERAEHVMIVDLERNDLGRVCRTGSVRVEAFAEVYSFPSLHHLVSQVAGELRPGVTLADVLRATFPGGSITGAPKIRAMEIIDELEPVARGFYTGAIGFIGDGGDAIFNLAIRTAVASRGRFTYHAGGGIVADSVPTREYDETLLKAQPFFAALRTRAA